MTVAVRRGTDRFTDRARGHQSSHGFSFGSHHDPDHVSFGPLIAHHEDLLGSRFGYPTHRHEDVELITWVVAGALVHTDEAGSAPLPAGSVAVTSAGTGTEHSEVAGDRATRFVQMWLRPDEPGGTPVRAVMRPADGSFVRLVGEGGLPLRVAGAALDLVRLGPGETTALPAAPRVHAYVVSGALARSSLAQPLAAGDAFLMTDEPAHEITATVPTQLLVWSFATLPMQRGVVTAGVAAQHRRCSNSTAPVRSGQCGRAGPTSRVLRGCNSRIHLRPRVLPPYARPVHTSENLGDCANDSDDTPVAAALLLLAHGLERLRSGALGEALEAMLALRALDTDLGHHTVTALAVTVHLHLARGDVREASASAIELLDRMATPGRDGGRGQVALGELAAALGDHEQAAAHYRAAGALVAGYDPEVPWRPGLAHVLVSIGLTAEAVALAEEELALALASGSSYAVATALRTLAAVGPTTDRIGLLRAALAALDDSASERLVAQLRTDLAGLLMLRPGGSMSEPAGLLRAAEAYAQREDLWPLQSRAQRLLGRLGERPSGPAHEAAHRLTGTERRVAALVARGSRNKEAATELGVSVKAIEWHLSRIYRKLKITSRGQLAAALGDSMVVPA